MVGGKLMVCETGRSHPQDRNDLFIRDRFSDLIFTRALAGFDAADSAAMTSSAPIVARFRTIFAVVAIF
jgi:hypothetical protein